LAWFGGKAERREGGRKVRRARGQAGRGDMEWKDALVITFIHAAFPPSLISSFPPLRTASMIGGYFVDIRKHI